VKLHAHLNSLGKIIFFYPERAGPGALATAHRDGAANNRGEIEEAKRASLQ
jgi:hypothetical protein